METFLSICIVSYNVENDIFKCLSSINEYLNCDYEIIVVDNASKDNTVEIINENFSDIDVVALEENVGFAKANNIAFKRSKGNILLFLNPDTYFIDNSLNDKELGDFLREKDTGAMGCLLLNEDKTPQKGSIRKFPKPFDSIVRMTFLRKIPFLGIMSRRYRMDDFDFYKTAYVEQISGAAFFVKRDVFENIGKFDENFFMFYEEVDLCKRIIDKGKRIKYNPNIRIVHIGGQSRKKDFEKIKSVNIKSLIYYFRKHLKGYKKYLFIIFFKFLFIIDLLLESIGDAFYMFLPLDSKKKEKRKEKQKFRKYFLKNHFKEFLLKW